MKLFRKNDLLLEGAFPYFLQSLKVLHFWLEQHSMHRLMKFNPFIMFCLEVLSVILSVT